MSIDFFLSVVALSFVPVVGFSASVIRLKLRILWLRLQEELGVLTRVMEENLGGIRVVRAFASQLFELARFNVISNRALAIMHRRIAIFVMGTTTMTFVFFLAMGLVLWIGGEKVLSGEITMGDLAAFLAFMAILQMPGSPDRVDGQRHCPEHQPAGRACSRSSIEEPEIQGPRKGLERSRSPVG